MRFYRGGQTLSTPVFVKEAVLSQPHPFSYAMSVADLVLQWESSKVVTMETIRPIHPQYLLSDLLPKKLAAPCHRGKH